MSQLDGLRNLGMVSNPPYLGEWPYRIGQYMLNFGAIELLSYRMLLLLEVTREQFNKNLGLSLSNRIARVLKLVESSRLATTEK